MSSYHIYKVLHKFDVSVSIILWSWYLMTSCLYSSRHGPCIDGHVTHVMTSIRCNLYTSFAFPWFPAYSLVFFFVSSLMVTRTRSYVPPRLAHTSPTSTWQQQTAAAFTPPPVDNEEATTDITPLLHAQGSDSTEALTSDDGDNTCSYPQAMHTDYEEATFNSTAPTPRHVSFVDTELSNIPTLSLARNISHQRSVFESFKESKLYRDWLLPNMPVSQADNNKFEISVLPSLEPVREDLMRLKALTPKSLPPYNPRLRTRRYPQILKHRLLPIGQFIVSKLKHTAEDKRGALELRLCSYIANNYWPLSTDEYTHLRIHEMYRNTLYMSARNTFTSQSSEIRVGGHLEQHLAQPMSKRNAWKWPAKSDSDHVWPGA